MPLQLTAFRRLNEFLTLSCFVLIPLLYGATQLMKSGTITERAKDFFIAIDKEFVPEDHERCARDPCRFWKQTADFVQVLFISGDIVLTVLDMSSAEK